MKNFNAGTDKKKMQNHVKQARSHGFTPLIIILSILALTALMYLNSRAMFGLSYGFDFVWVPSTPALAFVFPVMLVNLLFWLSKKKGIFDQAQLLTFYSILSGGAIIIGGWGWWIIVGNIAALPSLATGFDRRASGMASRFATLLEGIPEYVVPSYEAMGRVFWRGDGSVPWDVWVWPIIIWTVYFVIIFWIFCCISTIFHSYWTKVLHFPYPLAEPVLEMTSQNIDDKREGKPFWKNGVMWWGAAIPLFIGVWNDVFGRLILPGLPLFQYSYNLETFGNSLGIFWSHLISIWPAVHINIHPLVIGAGYLVANDVLFSLSFFYIFAQRLPRILPFVFSGVDWDTRWGLYRHAWMSDQFYGGVIAFCIVTVYMSREHLKIVWQRAIGLLKDENIDKDEGLSYRTAVFGALIGLVIIIAFNTFFLGVSILYSVVFFLIYFVLMLMFARSRVQLGLPVNRYNAIKADTMFIIPSFGGRTFGLTAIKGAGFNTSLTIGTLGSGMALAFESYVMADRSGMNKRTMTKALMFGVIVSLIIAFLVGLPFIYRYGYDQLGGYHEKHSRSGFQDISYDIFPSEFPDGTPPYCREHRVVMTNASTPEAQAIAVALTGFLSYMYSSFIWWPFHPLGYVMGVSEISTHLWSGFLLVWLIKVMIFRYGGASMYVKARPFFIGLIAGSGMWAVIVAILGLIPGIFY